MDGFDLWAEPPRIKAQRLQESNNAATYYVKCKSTFRMKTSSQSVVNHVLVACACAWLISVLSATMVKIFVLIFLRFMLQYMHWVYNCINGYKLHQYKLTEAVNKLPKTG